MDYIDATTSGILSPHVLPIVDLWKMLQHIADTLPPTLHLPILSVDTLHFYRYLHTHVLIENKQFLLLINIPIQDREGIEIGRFVYHTDTAAIIFNRIWILTYLYIFPI